MGMKPRKHPVMILATLDTFNFSFAAIGTTKAEALATIKKGWGQHRTVYRGAEPWSDWEDSVRFQTMKHGRCNHDGESFDGKE